MAPEALRPHVRSFLAFLALTGLLLTSLYLMGDATQNSARFGRLYSYLLILNVLGLVVLLGLIFSNLYRTVRDYRRRAPGARLTARLVVVFVLLSLAPVGVVYYFSMQFLQRSIDSWFDVRVDQSLTDALELGRAALDMSMREDLKQTQAMADQIDNTSEQQAAVSLNDLRGRSGVYELTLLTDRGRVIASSMADPTRIVPDRPPETVLLQLRQGRTYAALDLIRGAGLNVRVVVSAGRIQPSGDMLLLQALYPIADRMSTLADNVQSAYAHYRELVYLREPLKFSFVLTLSLVLLLSALAAVWAAFFAARRLVAPIGDLAQGTRAVAAGDFDTQLPVSSRDDLGFLVQSFNAMTRELARARDDARRSQEQLERERAYLEAILAHLSSGVVTVGMNRVVRSANASASQILGVDLTARLDEPLEHLVEEQSHLQPFVDTLLPQLSRRIQDWAAEVVLFGRQHQVLLCRGSYLPDVGEMPAGYVIVFDDVTALVQAQRDAAWSEVARRLAHEIKNPLTPIQLSAERLRHKYLKRLEASEGEVLDRLTHTIIQQVKVLKEMVNAFSDYARTPQLKWQAVDVNQVVVEVLDLYQEQTAEVRVATDLAGDLPSVQADPGRLRQVLHNLVKNALEALEGRESGSLQVGTRCVPGPDCWFAELRVEDNGPGIPETLLAHIFEPYVTTKPKGTGLGLAIVKKIVEEHGGVLWAENLTGGGTSVVIRFAVKHPESRSCDSAQSKEETT
jgi:two-component system, NtrC family, nitrogen regulation sensor histidine kinase NtrY